MKKTTCFLMASGLLALVAVGNLTVAQPPAVPVKASVANEADQAAVEKATQSFVSAFEKGDARAVAAHWTEQGEYFADDGTVFRGRDAIAKAYAELFSGKKAHIEASVEATSVRFPSQDTAIEEGYFKVRRDKGVPTSSKYTVLHVREGKQWLMAVVREWPSEGTPLRDLDWLIGTWEAKREDTTVSTTYAWWGDKSFIRVDIAIQLKDRTIKGFQMIGKDQSTGQIRSWTFDVDGSFAEAIWSRDGKKWVQDSAGVLDDGSVLAATNILTPIDNDAFTFQSVQRSVGDEEMADIPPIRVTRVTRVSRAKGE